MKIKIIKNYQHKIMEFKNKAELLEYAEKYVSNTIYSTDYKEQNKIKILNNRFVTVSDIIELLDSKEYKD